MLIAALLAAVLWFIARPPSADALYQTITTAARDGSSAKLKEAENDIDRFLSSYPSDPRRDEIAGYQQDIAASRKALTFDLKTRRTSNAQTLSPAELTYFEATQLAATDPESAAVKLQAIIDVFGGAVDDSAETKKAVELARMQIEQLQKAIETQRPKHLAAIHKQLDWAEQHRADDSAAAQAVCRGVIELYAGKPWAAAAVQRARKLLAKVVAVKDNDEAVDMKIVWVESTARARVAQIQWRGLPVDILAMTSLPDWSAEQWQRLFSVTTVSESLADPPPLLGDYRVDDRTVVFEPRFPLRPGVTYRAAFRAAGVPNFSSADIADLSREFSVPKLAVAAETVVTAIYPSGDVLPENLLRLYLHFSAPMSRGDAYARIRLLDESGRPVESPFLELGEELWNESQTRFTLLFDPGRIKRGLKPRELFGPALVEGQRYTLAIDREWPDAAGESLAAEATKSFAVIAPDDTQPDPQRWKLTPPAAETREPFVVNFDKPLDHAMLQRVLWITNSSQQPLAGTIAVAEQERRWSFVPRTAWQPGEYSLVIDTTLEDVAGNSIGRPFEVDVLRPASASDEPQTVVLKFRVE